MSIRRDGSKSDLLLDYFNQLVGDEAIAHRLSSEATWFACLFTQQLLVGFPAVAIPVHCAGMTMTEL